MDKEIIAIIRNLNLTIEEAEQQIREYNNSKLQTGISQMISSLPEPIIQIETGDNP